MPDLVADQDGFVDFGEMVWQILGISCDSAVHYLYGTGGLPYLAQDLRFTGSPANPHSHKIHVSDIRTFVERYYAYKRQRQY